MSEVEDREACEGQTAPTLGLTATPANWQPDLVSVILVNWNGERYVVQCLESLKRQTWPFLQVVFIDNASTDRSIELVELFEGLDIDILRNRENLGFAEANNQGIRVSKGEYVLFLNLDVQLDAQYVKQLVASLKEDAGLGSAMGKLYQLRDGRRTRFIDSTGICMQTNRRCSDRGQDREDIGQYERRERVFGACAAAALYRREALETLVYEGEYFDSAFFMYKEDVDLAWRALIRGWGSLFVPSAIGWHERRGSRGHLQRHIDVHSFKNRYLMILKNDRLVDVLRDIVPITLFSMIDLVKVVRWPYLGRSVPQVFNLLPRVLRWRRAIQSSRRAETSVPRRYFLPSRGMVRHRWLAWRNSWR